MTLHAAMQQVLLKAGNPLKESEIASQLNANKWYTKGDGSLIDPSQIRLRVKNYPHLFKKEGDLISLQSKTGIAPLKTAIQPVAKTPVKDLKDLDLLSKILMNPKNFKAVSKVFDDLPTEPGLYCLRIKDPNQLKASFRKELEAREHNIVYIGIASISLETRLKQELWANGHGTFFRSIGAVLGYTPEPGSLIDKKNKNNYTFSKTDEGKIIKWIEANLLINWDCVKPIPDEFEASLIVAHEPLLNWTHNPKKLTELERLKAHCRAVARN